MTMHSFTSNYEDNSTEAGFQFTFYCDLCHEGYKSKFIPSSTYKKGKLLRGLGGLIGAATNLTGQYGLGGGLERGADVLSERHEGMTPEWHKEYEKAFKLAQNEAKGHFIRCPKCRRYVCENDWNEQAGLCVEDAPRENVEVVAARASRMMDEIRERAEETRVFTGKIDSRTTLCPKCGKPSGEGKFCNNCGANLSMIECENCGTLSPAGTRFCGECGESLI